MRFYNVDEKFLDFLKTEEIKKRGFSNVPDYKYSNHKKFVCGIVLRINNYNYYAPLSSYKRKQENNIQIRDKKGSVISSIRFNYMFPCPNSTIKSMNFSEEKDHKYKRLLFTEYNFCKSNQIEICNLAKKTYEDVINNKNELLTKNSCDFLYLEAKCTEYEIKSDLLKYNLKVPDSIITLIDQYNKETGKFNNILSISKQYKIDKSKAIKNPLLQSIGSYFETIQKNNLYIQNKTINPVR